MRTSSGTLTRQCTVACVPRKAGAALSKAVIATGLLATGCPQLLDDSFQMSGSERLSSPAPAGRGGGSALPEPSTDTPPPNGGAGMDAMPGTSGGEGGEPAVAEGGGGGVQSTVEVGGEAGESGADGRGAVAGDAGTSLPTPPTPDAAAPCIVEAETCDGLDNDCDQEIDEGGACPSRCFGFVAQDVPHMYCDDAVTREDMESRCVAQDMRRVWIQSAQENDAIVEFVARTLVALGDVDEPSTDGSYGVWTGASDVVLDGDWRWGNTGPSFWDGADDGAPLDDLFNQWSPGRPDAALAEDCALLYVWGDDDGNDPGDWDDVSCDELHGFVCERP